MEGIQETRAAALWAEFICGTGVAPLSVCLWAELSHSWGGWVEGTITAELRAKGRMRCAGHGHTLMSQALTAGRGGLGAEGARRRSAP